MLKTFKVFGRFSLVNKIGRVRFAQATGTRANERDTEEDKEYENQEDVFEEEDYTNETTRQRNFRYARKAVGMSLFGLFAINSVYIYLDDSKREESSQRLLFLPYFYDIPLYIKNKFSEIYTFLLKPPMQKMLPDNPPIRQPFPIKTLVLNFEGTLYSKDFEAGKGVVLHLRPGFQKFIDTISKSWEVVIFSAEDSHFLTEASMTIDPMQRYFPWVFGREFMVFHKDGYYKDLSLLNRDPRKVVVVDMSADAYVNKPDNVIVLDKYAGSDDDQSLRYLGYYLNHLGAAEIRDVRKEIKRLGGPTSLENYKKELMEKQEKIKKSRKFLGGGDNRNKRV